MRTVEVNGVSLAVRSEGEGAPAFLFIHGAGSAQGVWDAQVEDLSRTLRCLTFDLRGHGQSSPAPAENVGTFVDDVAALVAREALAPCVLVGHGTGALLALLANERLQEAVAGVVLLDPPLRRPEPAESTVNAPEVFAEETPEAVRASVQEMLVQSQPAAVSVLEEAVGSVLLRYDELVKEADRKPFMVLWAGTPAGDPAALRDSTVFVRQEPFPGAGHVIQLERPEVTNALLRAFLDDIEHDPRIKR